MMKENFLGNNIHNLVKTKLKLSLPKYDVDNPPNFDELPFEITEKETVELIVKLIDFISKEFEKISLIKSKFLYKVLSLLFDLPDTIENHGKSLEKFIDECNLFSESAKQNFKSVLKYIGDLDEKICFSLTGEVTPNLNELMAVPAEIEQKIGEIEMRMQRARESNIGKFCNGGGGGVFSHIGSFGFCTGYTAGYAYDALSILSLRYPKKVAFWSVLFASTVFLGYTMGLPLLSNISLFFLKRLILKCALPELANEIRDKINEKRSRSKQSGDCNAIKCFIQGIVDKNRT